MVKVYCVFSLSINAEGKTMGVGWSRMLYTLEEAQKLADELLDPYIIQEFTATQTIVDTITKQRSSDNDRST